MRRLIEGVANMLQVVPPLRSPDACAQPEELVAMLEAIEERVVMLAENGRLDAEAASDLLEALARLRGELT